MLIGICYLKKDKQQKSLNKKRKFLFEINFRWKKVNLISMYNHNIMNSASDTYYVKEHRHAVSRGLVGNLNWWVRNLELPNFSAILCQTMSFNWTSSKIDRFENLSLKIDGFGRTHWTHNDEAPGKVNWLSAPRETCMRLPRVLYNRIQTKLNSYY